MPKERRFGFPLPRVPWSTLAWPCFPADLTPLLQLGGTACPAADHPTGITPSIRAPFICQLAFLGSYSPMWHGAHLPCHGYVLIRPVCMNRISLWLNK